MLSRALKFVVILALVVGGATGCATAPKKKAAPTGHERNLKEVCLKNNIQWKWDSVSQLITLTFGGNEATALIDSEVVIIGTEEVVLSAPLKIVRSAIIVPVDFNTKVIERLKRTAVIPKVEEIPPARRMQIVIDAGHGGKDPGAIGLTGTNEKNVVLDISKRLKKILEEKNFKVIMTRDSDEFISLQERTEITSKTDADLFVSIHANSNPSRAVSGLEVYSLKDLDYLEKKEEQRVTNHKLLCRHLSMDKNADDVHLMIAEMLYDKKQSSSIQLSETIAKELSNYAKTKNRGSKESRFFVLRNTLIPAVLVEVGFLTNAKEEKLLKDGAHRQKIAQGVANGILDYVRAQ